MQTILLILKAISTEYWYSISTLVDESKFVKNKSSEIWMFFILNWLKFAVRNCVIPQGMQLISLNQLVFIL